MGIELDAVEAACAQRSVPSSEVLTDDLFRWFSEAQYGQWDGVAGNPPFIRYQHWIEETRERAFFLMQSIGMRPNRLTNAWLPFMVASTVALRDGGRLGVVVPAELLQVGYASELRALLVDSYSELTVVAFRDLLFEGVLQEVVLVLGVKGPGPAAIRIVEVEDAAALPDDPLEVTSVPHAPTLLHDREKWTRYFLEPDDIELLRRIRDLTSLDRLRRFAEVDVGIVTGRNAFFVLRPEEASRLGVEGHCTPLTSKSAHIKGVEFRPEDLRQLGEEDGRCLLLMVDDSVALSEHPALRLYVEEGEAAEVHRGYKCSIRKKWWVVPSVWTPDAFMLRQIYDHPRIAANLTTATSTDTIHRVRVSDGVDNRALAAASINSATFAFSEVLGRSYGGGVLELEPREAEDLPFPSPEALDAVDITRVDELVRAGRLADALDYIDHALLIEACGLSPAEVDRLRAIWVRLRDRRLTRGRSNRKRDADAKLLAA